MVFFSSLTVKAAVFRAILEQFAVRLQRRAIDKHPGVEAVWPAGIRGGGQLFSVEQLIDV